MRAAGAWLVVASALALTAGGGQAAPDTGSQTFSDATGDQDGLAPDITSVRVTQDAGGAILFELANRNYSSVRPRVSFTVLIDADRNSRSGMEGAEYLLTGGCQGVDRCGGSFWRWNGANWDAKSTSSYSSTFTAEGSGGVMRFRIGRADLGGVAAFDFFVNAYYLVSEPLNYDADRAPERGATWTVSQQKPKPVADRDRDGVADAKDRCPRARAVFDTNRNGCAGPFRVMRPDLKFRALGYPSYVSFVSARVEDLPAGAEVEVRCSNSCRLQRRQSARTPVVVLAALGGARLPRGAVVEVRAVKRGWIGYYARIEIGGSPLTARTTELCLPALEGRTAVRCDRAPRGL